MPCRKEHMDMQGVETAQTNNAFFWDLYAKTYDNISHLMPYRKLLWDCLQALDLKPGMKLLHLGCDSGNFEEFLLEKEISNVRVDCLDFRANRLAMALNKVKHSNISFKLIDKSYDFSKDKYDRILLDAHLLYKLPLNDLLSTLNHQGKLVVLSQKTSSFKIIKLCEEQLKRTTNIWSIRKKLHSLIQGVYVMLIFSLSQKLVKYLNRDYFYVSKESINKFFDTIKAQSSIKDSCANHFWLATANSIKNTHNLANYNLKIPIRIENSLKYEKNNIILKFIHFFSIHFFNLLPAFIGKRFFLAFSNDTKKVRNTVTTHEALETMYTFKQRVKNKTINLFDIFWENFLCNARAVRNRLKLVKNILSTNISSRDDKAIKILSLGSGSARAVIEVISNYKNGDLIEVTLIDMSRNAINYSKNLAEKYSVKNVKHIRGNVLELDKLVNGYRPDIVEMVGLLDYFDELTAQKLIEKIFKKLKNDGLLITCNVNNNVEKPFVSKSIGWPLIYRKPEQLCDLLIKSGFHPTDIEVQFEPLKVHGLYLAKKSEKVPLN